MSQDEEEEKKEGWTGKGEFGYVQTSGNTDTSALNLALEFTYEKDKWRHRLGATALRSEQDGELDAEMTTRMTWIVSWHGLKERACCPHKLVAATRLEFRDDAARPIPHADPSQAS
jgi:hypothetical protein